MEHAELIPRKPVSREQMMKRVARFSKLKGSDGGLPDSHMPGSERILYNVIGFQPPETEDDGVVSPVGEAAARMAAVKISEGFNLGYCRALPGKGPMMHNHDTNETFIGITGMWRASWENEAGKVEHIDLKPLDVVSIPPGAIRRFENVTKGPADEYSILMFVIAGDAPGAEFTREAMTKLDAAGLLGDNVPPPAIKSIRGKTKTAPKLAATKSKKAKKT
jgi:oxalate decarboxylase/phosphoglucose isomerase-like protein (cupin superfamily)